MKRIIVGLLAALGIALGAASFVAPAHAQQFWTPSNSPHYGAPFNPADGGGG